MVDAVVICEICGNKSTQINVGDNITVGTKLLKICTIKKDNCVTECGGSITIVCLL